MLYFRARNNTYRRVPQFVSEGLRADGGITVYYIPSPDANEKVTAFTPGFRMLVGNAASREPGQERKVCHRCMPATGDNSNVNCGAPDSQSLPTEMCPGGIRSVITFPTCWDGKNTDSPDHMSHVAYPNSSYSDVSVGAYGTCPASHPVKIPQVMYEVMWDVSAYPVLFKVIASRGVTACDSLSSSTHVAGKSMSSASYPARMSETVADLLTRHISTDPDFQR